jgi:hypothetical protein
MLLVVWDVPDVPQFLGKTSKMRTLLQMQQKTKTQKKP